MSKKKVHIIGTGTIGEPLIGLFCDFKEELGIDQVSFHKRSPLTYDRSKVKDLMKRGAKLVVDNDKWDDFKEIMAPFTDIANLPIIRSLKDATMAALKGAGSKLTEEALLLPTRLDKLTGAMITKPLGLAKGWTIGGARIT